MRQVDFAVRIVHRALANVEADRFTPATLSVAISDYLIDLAVQHANGNTDFYNFIVSLPYGAIEVELLRQIIPDSQKMSILGLRDRHEALEIKKEVHCANQEFDSAALCRDQQTEIAQEIRRLISGYQLSITPDIVDSSLRSLGYKGFDASNP